MRILPSQAFLLAALICVPSFFYLLYRAVVPYEPAIPEHRLAGSLFYPGIAGFVLGIVHAVVDPGLVETGAGGIAYTLIFPIIETYAVVVIFNRTFFYKQPATAVYYAMGGGALAFGLAFVDVFRALSNPAQPLGDLGYLAIMIAFASAMVLFHASKGLILGTYFAEQRRTRGVAIAVVLQVPFGALLLAGRFPGVDPGPVVAFMLVYAGLLYYLAWHVFFKRHMPDPLRKILDQERKRARRLAIARERK